MTTLFHRLQPRQKFRITVGALAKHAVKLIAQLLKIPKSPGRENRPYPQLAKLTGNNPVS